MIYFLFYVHLRFARIYVCVRVSDALNLEVQTVVSCYVGNGNWTLDLSPLEEQPLSYLFSLGSTSLNFVITNVLKVKSLLHSKLVTRPSSQDSWGGNYFPRCSDTTIKELPPEGGEQKHQVSVRRSPTNLPPAHV